VKVCGYACAHQRLSAHIKVKVLNLAPPRARAARARWLLLRCAACCSVIQQRRDLHDAARAADAREARLFKNVMRGLGGSSSAGRSPAIRSLLVL
jgi:hypothetical protein